MLDINRGILNRKISPEPVDGMISPVLYYDALFLKALKLLLGGKVIGFPVLFPVTFRPRGIQDNAF